jgi:hypothetical protein
MQGDKVGGATVRLLECCHPRRGATWLGMAAAPVVAPCGFAARVGRRGAPLLPGDIEMRPGEMTTPDDSAAPKSRLVRSQPIPLPRR